MFLRPKGGFSISDLSGLYLWLKASDTSTTFQDAAKTTTAINDTDPIECWADKSGRGNDFTQTDAAKKPLLKTGANGINNKSVIRFDGTSDILVNATNFLSSSQGAVFAVVRLTDPIKTYQDVFGSARSTSNSYYWLCRAIHSTSNYIHVNQKDNDTEDRVRGNTLLVSGTRYLMAWMSNGTSFDLQLNGVSESLTIASGANNGDWLAETTGRDQFSLGAYRGSVEGNWLKGDIAEIVMLDNQPDNSTLEKIVNYFSAEYGNFYNVVGFGDSIVSGTAATVESNRFINIIANTNGWALTNAGIASTVLQNTVQNTVSTIGGAVDNNGRDTYAARVVSYNPDVVIILYGLNDLRLNDVAFSEANFQNDLEEIIDGIVAAGVSAQNIVIGSPPYIPNASYALFAPYNGGSAIKHAQYVTASAAVASTKGTKYIDVYQWMVDNGGDALISGDGVHPNDAGHAQIAAAFLSVL